MKILIQALKATVIFGCVQKLNVTSDFFSLIYFFFLYFLIEKCLDLNRNFDVINVITNFFLYEFFKRH